VEICTGKERDLWSGLRAGLTGVICFSIVRGSVEEASQKYVYLN
jgi:hypothetical protein